MFTPEGYWSWTELVDASAEWTLEILAASLAPELTSDRLENDRHRCKQTICEKLVASNRVENRKEAAFSLELLELWVLANFMDSHEAVLCSPDGRTLRCPPLIKAHGDAFDWWIWPLSKEKMSHGEAVRYFEAFREGIFHIGHAQERFCAIDYETGTIRLKPNTVNLLWSASYGHCASEADILRFIEDHIRPIVGWSICWNPEDIPDTKMEVFGNLGFGDLNWEAQNGSKAKRQTDTTNQKHIIDCLATAFPDGKGSATWSTVEKKVGYSRRSIVRALKQNGQYSEWAALRQRQ